MHCLACRLNRLQAMLGNRYGFQPFPSTITAAEFEHFITISEELQLGNRLLLCEWFYRDDNAVDPEYVLQVKHLCY